MYLSTCFYCCPGSQVDKMDLFQVPWHLAQVPLHPPSHPQLWKRLELSLRLELGHPKQLMGNVSKSPSHSAPILSTMRRSCRIYWGTPSRKRLAWKFINSFLWSKSSVLNISSSSCVQFTRQFVLFWTKQSHHADLFAWQPRKVVRS